MSSPARTSGSLTPPRPPTTLAPIGVAPALPLRTRLEIFSRLFAIQGAWNYEILLGNGLGFCLEPALRRLGGPRDPRFREALARESRYFNAHPYMASVAVGALARSELDGESPARIERFRTALCGPLGSVGDRLIWAAFLPFCSLLALAAFGFGASATATVLLFLLLYNAGHIALRIWGWHLGYTRGMHVARALGHPIFRHGPEWLGRASALIAGVALPLALWRAIGPGRVMLGGVLGAVVLGAILLARARGRAEGWRIALGVLALFALYSVVVDA